MTQTLVPPSADAPAPAPAPNQLAGRAVRGGSILLLARFGMQGLTWTVTLLVARLLDKSDYGIMTWAMVSLGLMEFLAEAGIGRALVQKEDFAPADRDEAFTITLGLVALLYAGLYFASDFIAVWLAVPALAVLLKVIGLMSWMLPFRTVAVSILDREQKLGQQAIAHVIMSGMQAALVLGLAYNGFGYWALAIGALWARLTETLLLCYAAGWWPRIVWPGEAGWQLLSFGLYASGASFFCFVSSNVDFVVVGKLFGESTLGAYALAFQLMSLPMQRLTVNMNHLAYPVFCRLQHDPARLRDWYLRLTVLQGFVGMPALVGMALVASDAFPLLLGEKWLPSVVPFQLLALTGVVMMYAATMVPLFNALGWPSINFYYTFSLTLILPGAFVIGGYLGGLTGVCLVWLTVYPLVPLAMIHLTRNLTGITLWAFVRAQAPVILGTLVMVGSVEVLRLTMTEQGLARLLASIVVGVASYIAIMAVVGQSILADIMKLWREGRGALPQPTSCAPPVAAPPSGSLPQTATGLGP